MIPSERAGLPGGTPDAPPPVGFLSLDKPEGPTSHDMVARARRALGTRKVGHSGTLDPFASGLLLLAVGPATRLLEYLAPLEKEYVATARLGETTETLDPEGEPIWVSDAWKGLGEGAVVAALRSFLGESEQLPPVFSAKKVGGEPAHRRVRRGEDVHLDPARVVIHEVELLGLDLPEVRFRVRCSTGTYIRSLARDLGDRLGTGAFLTSLRRTAIGAVRVEDALPAADLELPDSAHRALISPAAVLTHLPQLELPQALFRRLSLGQSVRIPPPSMDPEPASAPPGGPWVVTGAGVTDALIVAECGENGLREEEGMEAPSEDSETGRWVVRPKKVVVHG